MIIMFKKKDQPYDFVALNSLDYALKRVSGPTVPWALNIDFSKANQLALIGHGAPGQIAGVDAKDIAARMGHLKYGVPDTLDRLIITSCYAGARVRGKCGSSVAEVLADALCSRKVKSVVISGAKGPSVKADALGDQFSVVDDKKRTQVQASQLTQEVAAKIVKPIDLVNLPPDKSKFLTQKGNVTIIQGNYFEAREIDTNNSFDQFRMQIAAAAAARGAKKFYQDFVADMKKNSLLLGGSNMLTIEINHGVSKIV